MPELESAQDQLIGRLQVWSANGGELRLDLPHDFHVSTAREAIAVCEALTSKHVLVSSQFSSPLHELTGFFQAVQGNGAADVLRERGLPILRRILRQQIADLADERAPAGDKMPIGGTLLFVAKVIALYAEVVDAKLLVDLARVRCLEDEYLWGVVLHVIAERHPAAVEVCEALRDPLPNGFLNVAYLDFANSLVLSTRLPTHPFASRDGEERLFRYVSESDPADSSYAISAIAAAPYLPAEARVRLLTAGDAHADPMVRMEVAWAREKTGDRRGRAVLAAFCADPRFALRASRYLDELALGSEIPPAARAPEFVAQAEMCDWLAHPNEFGYPPDRVATLDTRTLFWPPTSDRRQLWLIRYEYDASGELKEADVGVGLVGSVTFALFGEATADVSPEDVYGLHCCFELEVNNDRRAPKKRSAALGRMMLAKRNRGF